jgi:hypothetical protein
LTILVWEFIISAMGAFEVLAPTPSELAHRVSSSPKMDRALDDL